MQFRDYSLAQLEELYVGFKADWQADPDDEGNAYLYQAVAEELAHRKELALFIDEDDKF